MIHSDDLWHPQGVHGTLILPADPVGQHATHEAVETSIRERVRRLVPPGHFDDIKVCIKPQPDGTSEVFFELVAQIG